LNQSREAHPLGLSAPLPPRGASRPRFLRTTSPPRGHDLREQRSRAARWYAGGRRRVQRRDPRRVQRRVDGLGHSGTGRDRQGCGACQRSSTRRRRVPPRHRPWPAWSRAGGQGRMAAPSEPARRRGAGHSSLTAGQLAPPAPRGVGRARWPAGRGEGAPPRPPSGQRRPGQDVTRLLCAVKSLAGCDRALGDRSCPVSPNLARQHAADLRRTRFAETASSWLSH
jgi:hypothetical protein